MDALGLGSTTPVLSVTMRFHLINATSPAMKTKNLGMLLLAAHLILVGLIGTFSISLGGLSIITPILALSAGVCLLLGK
jgi:hypothetical protein